LYYPLIIRLTVPFGYHPHSFQSNVNFDMKLVYQFPHCQNIRTAKIIGTYPIVIRRNFVFVFDDQPDCHPGSSGLNLCQGKERRSPQLHQRKRWPLMTYSFSQLSTWHSLCTLKKQSIVKRTYNIGNRSFRHMPFLHMPICHSQFAICADSPYNERVCSHRTRARLGLVSPAGLG